jgi:hypothetical protein
MMSWLVVAGAVIVGAFLMARWWCGWHMSDDCRFWWDWVLHALSALATFSAVVVALFKDPIRARFSKLSIGLKNPEGEFNEMIIAESGERIESRWYHIKVRNPRRGFTAKSVRPCLLRVEKTNAFGRYETTWTGEMPFLWKDVGPITPDLGPEIDCDLCSVTYMLDGPILQLHPFIPKMSIPTLWRHCQAKCALTFQARSLLIDSNLLRIEIVWNGQWARNTEEMARHLVVTELPP